MNKLSKIIYGIFTGVTIVSFTSLLVWGITGSSDNVKENIEVELVTTDAFRREYLVEEEIDLSNAQLKIDEKVYIDAEDCKVDYDFSSAGDKVVNLSYEHEGETYVSSFMVEVFSVRHLDVRDKTITVNRDGTWNTSSLLVWAELNKPAFEFEKPAEYPKIDDTIIILTEKQYDFTVTTQDREGYYISKVTSGLAEYAFETITNTEDPKVNSYYRILSLTNASGTEDKLTLFAQQSSNNFVTPNGSEIIEVTGMYVLEDAYGNKTNYNFAYSLDGWTSKFKSEEYKQGLKDYQGYKDPNDENASTDGEAYTVEVNGLTFFARGSEWHRAIIAM